MANTFLYVAWWWQQSPLLSACIDTEQREGERNELELKIVKSKYHREKIGKYKIMPGDEVYFIYPFTIFPEKRFLEQNPQFRLVYSLPKPGGKRSVNLYKATIGSTK